MWWIVILLIIIGIAMLVLEITVIPGAGVAGIIGFLMMVGGIWFAYTRIGFFEGNIVLISTFVINIVGITFTLRSKTWKKAMLKTEITSKVNVVDPDNFSVGDKGVTIGRCAPMGKALINGSYLEVSALSDFIDEDSEIEIIRISGNKIYIKTN
jgi:membrane-bound ClpP family serine protease